MAIHSFSIREQASPLRKARSTLSVCVDIKVETTARNRRNLVPAAETERGRSDPSLLAFARWRTLSLSPSSRGVAHHQQLINTHVIHFDPLVLHIQHPCLVPADSTRT